MKTKSAQFHKNRAAVLIIVSVFLIVSLSFISGLFGYPEYKLYDFRVNIFARSRRPSEDIIVALLDQRSIDWALKERGWGWPWPRKAYAEFTEYMRLGGAKSVAFDVLFSEPSVYRNSRQDEIINTAVENLRQSQDLMAEGRFRDAGSYFRGTVQALQELSGYEDDASFAQAEKDSGRVVQTVFFSGDSGSLDAWPKGLDKPLFELSGFDDLLPAYARLSKDGGGTVRAQFPIDSLRDNAAAIACITGWPDSDGIVRRMNLFTLFDGKAVPGLSAASLLVSGHDNSLVYDATKKRIRWGGYSIPVDNQGRSILRFRGSLDRYIPYGISDILQSAESYAKGEEPLLPPEDFKDKYIFFGFYAPGLYDIFSSPISSTYPGVGVHITMMDNILNQDFIRESPVWLGLLIILAVIILAGILGLYQSRISVTLAGTILVCMLTVFLGFFAYAALDLWLPMAAPLTGVVLAFLITNLYNYATEGSQKRFIKSAFSRYLAPSVIEQIIADPSQLKLGGERREMTAIFTDIQRFSSISSELQDQYGERGPEVLVNLLNLYLTEMSNIVLANGGTIDKYEGDAIIAFFGAPVRTEKHAILACLSAVQMKKRERELREEIMKPGGPFCAPLSKLIADKVIRMERPLYTRLGINSGDMVVGNMGTPNKMDYTIMGNAVNLAARLEGVNKQYNTHGILISEYTRKYIGDEFVIRPLSRVTVVGIPTPLRLFELLETRENAPARLLDMIGLWEQAFAAYESREFGKGRDIFAEICRQDEGDDVARLYLNRCEKLIEAPPAPDWKGVDNLTEK
ncbi:MAG: adenylate/guanylate cyclase domain-containing protein [Treponema sp.]|jgi:adenylate cyclase|nr:adenylate/guanylate cyclase domain-containing protein [Treponema sp.]